MLPLAQVIPIETATETSAGTITTSERGSLFDQTLGGRVGFGVIEIHQHLRSYLVVVAAVVSQQQQQPEL